MRTIKPFLSAAYLGMIRSGGAISVSARVDGVMVDVVMLLRCYVVTLLRCYVVTLYVVYVVTL